MYVCNSIKAQSAAMAVELAPQAARILIPLIIKVPHTIVPQLCHDCATTVPIFVDSTVCICRCQLNASAELRLRRNWLSCAGSVHTSLAVASAAITSDLDHGDGGSFHTFLKREESRSRGEQGVGEVQLDRQTMTTNEIHI